MTVSPEAVHLDAPLTNITVAEWQDQSVFIADRIFPNVGVEKQSDKYYVYDNADFNRDEMKALAPGAEPEAVEFGFSDDAYYCTVYGNRFDLTDQMLANEDKQLRVRSNASRTLAMKGLIKREKEFIGNFFNPGVWATDWTGVASSPSGTQVVHWDDYANSTPIEDVRRQSTAMMLVSGGFRPNKMVMTQDVYDVLVNHPDILARISGGATPGNAAFVTKELMAMAFEVSELHVIAAVENTAKEGAAKAHAFMANKQVALYYTADAPGLEVPTAGYTFTWSSLENVSDLGINILSFTGEDLVRKGIKEQLQIRMAWDMKVTAASLGGFIDGVIS